MEIYFLIQITKKKPPSCRRNNCLNLHANLDTKNALLTSDPSNFDNDDDKQLKYRWNILEKSLLIDLLFDKEFPLVVTQLLKNVVEGGKP